ncbi:hypothetical protein CLF_111008 [Clonorchis sinensis]|uniref:Uncharacterized protein n=1 Tax=Clonorchis sinensis TaxID=79923 RepID=G7YU68_CLOSI|nr:hypothetical protein CLF_111008 [Clonorchis sinensis]
MVLKKTSFTLVKHFYLVIRQSLDKGDLPSAWKVAIIYKTGDQLSTGSHRPTNLTSVQCKVMEGIPKRAILDHLTTNNSVSPV